MNTVYNRYIPQSDGSFQKNRIPEQTRPSARKVPESIKKQPHCPPPTPEAPPKEPPSYRNTGASGFLRQLLPKELDTGDLLIVLLLLLMAGDCEEEKNNALLTLALYFFL